MTLINRPMLACSTTLTREDTAKLRFPVYVSDKEDGIRCLLMCKDAMLQPFSRKLKVIPNLLVRQWAKSEGVAGLDGEIVIPMETFHEIQSWVMSEITFPRQFEYRVFDHWRTAACDLGYLQRLQIVQRKLDRYAPKNTVLVPITKIDSDDELWEWFEYTLKLGKEGLIVRSPDGPYKQGRSTMNEQYMLKMKHYEEGEATILDFIPEYENTNEKKQDETGYAKRSSHKVGRVPRERLGALVCQDHATREVFQLGSGMDHGLKEKIWNARSQYCGATVTYKWQVHGTKDKPRTPIFKGIRRD